MDEKQFLQVAEQVKSLQIKNQTAPTLNSTIENILERAKPKTYHCQVCGNETYSAGRCDSCRVKRILEWNREKRKSLVFVRRKKIEMEIPPLYKKAKISFLNKKLCSAIRTKQKEKGLLLWGPVGSGKTWAACALWRDYLASGKSVERRTYRELLIEIRGSFVRNEDEAVAIKQFLFCDVLIIEDLAACKNTEFAIDTILHIIDHRIEHLRPTIITSNLSPENIERVFGERLGSRLKTFLTLKIGGEDKRDTNKAQKDNLTPNSDWN